jgi:shikimate kinase
MLGCGKTTIGNELSRNAVNDEYVADKVQAMATASRQQTGISELDLSVTCYP